ncbi:MAG: hypothetical protein QGH45_20695 [Myxococcota bacterium]|jgi:hypothetical protein|nr:hypothetical protein [Myxococcota bacterium]
MERFAVEKPTADALKARLRAGIETGTVRADLDVAQAAWLINNTYVMLAAPLASRHFHIRMTEYLGGDASSPEPDMGQHLERTLGLLGAFLRPTDDSGEGQGR